MTAQNNSGVERLFEAIEHGRRVRRDATGWRMGAIAVADALVDDLLASGRVRRSGDRLMPATPAVARERPVRMLAEQALPQDGEERPSATRVRARSVTVNIMESPLGWLRARNLVSARQI